MKKVALDANFFKMEIYMLELIHKTKSMEKGLFIGLIFVTQLAPKILQLKYNNIMVNGGADYQMEKDSI